MNQVWIVQETVSVSGDESPGPIVCGSFEKAQEEALKIAAYVVSFDADAESAAKFLAQIKRKVGKMRAATGGSFDLSEAQNVKILPSEVK